MKTGKGERRTAEEYCGKDAEGARGRKIKKTKKEEDNEVEAR